MAHKKEKCHSFWIKVANKIVKGKNMKSRLLAVISAMSLCFGLLAGCGASKSAYEPVLPTETEEAEIFVEAIDNLPEDFIKGMDISSVLSEEASGVVYYNKDGQEEDLFKILADSGVNYIRVRVWNDPFNENGKGYGGGNCNVDTACEIGKRAAEYGMKLLVDFHYSDFWADPKKQFAPKAWENASLDEKESLIFDYTKESLQKIVKSGANVGMVQIGNEINYGMAGETSSTNVAQLLCSASKAVREVDENIKIAVHYTNINNEGEAVGNAAILEAAGVDYDVFGVSYYTYWHGSMENLTSVLTEIKEKYGKETCVLETSYCYTGEDGDGSSNSITEDGCIEEYPVSVQGQANCVRDVMAAANKAGALGVFYWEGAWVPVTDKGIEVNSPIWEEYGSGWASSYAKDYDPNDAGQYYGGSSWDNQAMFDFSGKALPSLDVFKYVNYGATGALQVLEYKGVEVSLLVDEELKMPETVEVIYNDPSIDDGMKVEWDDSQLEIINTSIPGEYAVDGVLEDGTAVTANVIVKSVNYVENPSFEDADMSVWRVEHLNGNECTDIQTKDADAYDGEKAFHFWSESEQEFTVEQTIVVPSDGLYDFVARAQGGDVGAGAKVYAYVKMGDEMITSEDLVLDGWVNWKEGVVSDIALSEGDEVTVGMYVKCDANGWGTIDALEFNRVSYAVE